MVLHDGVRGGRVLAAEDQRAEMRKKRRGGKSSGVQSKWNAPARSAVTSVAVNFINSPKVHIDRVTGRISISGKAGDYSGQCEVIPADATAKF